LVGSKGTKAEAIVWTLGLTFVVGYLGLVALLYLFQAALIYYPTHAWVGTPADRGLAYRDVALKTSDGLTLSAWWVPAQPARAVVLFCHGNGGNISHRLDTLALFHRLGLSTLIFDYRGYGRSEGMPSEQGTYLDAEAAWRHLVDEMGIAPHNIVLFGRSLGGVVAAHLAQDRQAGALILESAFTSVPDIGHEIYPFFPIHTLSRFSYNARTYVSRARSPVLVVHSRDDEIVPFHHGQALFEAAPQPKEFLEIRGGHNVGFLSSGRQYEQGLADFLSRHLAPPASGHRAGR
jgi:hypothetical protein